MSLVAGSGKVTLLMRGRKKWYTTQMKVREVVRLLRDDGWVLVRTRGSHHQYKHPTKPGLVTIPGNGNDELAAGTLNSVMKQAGLKP